MRSKRRIILFLLLFLAAFGALLMLVPGDDTALSLTMSYRGKRPDALKEQFGLPVYRSSTEVEFRAAYQEAHWGFSSCVPRRVYAPPGYQFTVFHIQDGRIAKVVTHRQPVCPLRVFGLRKAQLQARYGKRLVQRKSGLALVFDSPARCHRGQAARLTMEKGVVVAFQVERLPAIGRCR